MRRRIGLLFALGCLAGVSLVAPSGAFGATTLGSTTRASGASPAACGTNDVIAQVNSDPSTPYSAPGSGTITQWQINASLDSASDAVTLVVLRPVGASFTVVDVDRRTIPSPVPAVATYTLAKPIAVSAGDTFGLYTNSFDPPACYFYGGSTPTTDTIRALTALSPPAHNQTLHRDGTDSPGGFTMNLAATFEPTPTPPVIQKKKSRNTRRSTRAPLPRKSTTARRRSGSPRAKGIISRPLLLVQSGTFSRLSASACTCSGHRSTRSARPSCIDQRPWPRCSASRESRTP